MLAVEPEIIEKYVRTGKVKLVFRDVLNHGERSERASEAAACAGNQGYFWDMHSLLFEGQDMVWGTSNDSLLDLMLQFGSQIDGLELETYRQCLEERATLEKIKTADAEQRGRGITSQPIFEIENQRLVGLQSIEVMSEVIEEAVIMKEDVIVKQNIRSNLISRRLILFSGASSVAFALLALVFFSSNESTISAFDGQLFPLLPAAFLAGTLSFLSPCTLPILPAYFAFTFQARKQNVVLMTITFFLGLATTLVLLGASATAVSSLLLRNLEQLTIIGGLLIIVFGIMSFFGKGFSGPQIQERPASTVLGSYLIGATFALGWTACVGPILGAILTLLATQGLAVFQGALLSFIFALGLGFPLILVSTFFSRLGQGSQFWKIMRGRGFTLRIGNWSIDLHTTNVLSGTLLIGMGYLLASGQLNLITQSAAVSDLALWVIEAEERLRTIIGLK